MHVCLTAIISYASSLSSTCTQTSVPDQKSSTVEDSATLTFEDRRKQNFEAGRMELQRRKKMLQEQQEKAAVSFERPSLEVVVYCYWFSFYLFFVLG